MIGNFENETQAAAELNSKGRNAQAILKEAKVSGVVYHDGARVKIENDESVSVGWAAWV